MVMLMEIKYDELQIKIKNTVEQFHNKYGQDSRTKNLNELVGLWLDNINDEDKEIFLKLLNNFSYYNKESIIKYANFIGDEVTKIDDDFNETIILPLTNEKGMNGAYEIVRAIQQVNGLDKSICPVNLKYVEDTYPLNKIKNIIIVDDISGTGITFEKSVKYMINTYEKIFIEKNIYLSCIVMSEEAELKISKMCMNENMKYWRYDIIKKAFSENYIFSNVIAESSKEKVKKYELLLNNGNDNKNIFGFGNSELLVAFSDNTPNNTILSFWKEEKGWRPIFPRVKTRKAPWAREIKNNMKRNIAKNIRS